MNSTLWIWEEPNVVSTHESPGVMLALRTGLELLLR